VDTFGSLARPPNTPRRPSDVAHTVATHHLAASEPGLAADAARVAVKAGSFEDTPLLALVAGCDDRG
jgi:hypothetical protein